MEKRYNREIQTLCKTPCFGTFQEELPGTTDKGLLNDVVDVATRKAPFISSMVSSIGPSRLS